ncbi:thermonuclease family protein [Pseudooceanicola algae]|uniref:thermonuclease family protein n=1 Tax=Pseudooceanicola algae TaxID=1537215 RepID=UPI001E3A72FD|nr:thermonuclease family protein [Pseudooceanicola algae]
MLKGKCYVIDGDTVVISGTRIRIAGIDAPELDHPWGKKAKFTLIGLCKGQIITATLSEEMSYDRVVATCHLQDGTDLAARLVEEGLALDWPKFSGGAYRHLEPPGVRRKLWRAAARQQGRMKPAESDQQPEKLASEVSK